MQTTSAVSLETEHDGSFHGFQGFMKRSTATAYLSPKRIYPRTLTKKKQIFPRNSRNSTFSLLSSELIVCCMAIPVKSYLKNISDRLFFSFFLGPYPSLVALVNLLIISRHNRRFLQHQSVDDGADLLG
jgi:hypothetical protein